MLSDAQLDDIKTRNPVDAVAGQWVKLRRKGGRDGGTFVGPCPICSRNTQSKSATRFECDADEWKCAVCPGGGDVISLVRKRDGLSFTEAVERLGGAGIVTETPASARRRGVQDFRAGVAGDDPLNVPPQYSGSELAAAWLDGWRSEERRERGNALYRERERARLFRMWTEAGWILAGTPAHQYLCRRGYDILPRARLRSHPNMPMFADGREQEPRMLHRGPAMLAAIIGADGRFVGLHITWLDPRGPKGKARVIDALTGEVMPAKKSRGSKAGGYIDLGYIGDRPGPRMFVAEGIETLLAAYTALLRSGRLREGDRFRCAIDLGNLAGKAIETVEHPTLKTEKGRPQRVPGPDPDLASRAMPVPDDVEELVILGDGDSEPFLTRNAVERSRRRHSREGRVVRCVWPAEKVQGA